MLNPWFLQSKKESGDTVEPIEVSEDTVEAGADENAEGGGNAQGVNEEVDQPAGSFGISASGFLDVDFLL